MYSINMVILKLFILSWLYMLQNTSLSRVIALLICIFSYFMWIYSPYQNKNNVFTNISRCLIHNTDKYAFVIADFMTSYLD